jgi:hypothetical protein
MAIKELHLHGVTSITAFKPSKQWNSKRIRFETVDGTSFVVVAFAESLEGLELNIKTDNVKL